MVLDIIRGQRTDQMSLKAPFEVNKEEENPKKKPKVENQNEESISSNSSDSTVLYNTSATDKKHDVNKDNFFSSDSEATTYSSGFEGGVRKGSKRKKMEKNEGGKEENGNRVDEEDKELEKLLRMSDMNTRPSSTNVREEKECKEGKYVEEKERSEDKEEKECNEDKEEKEHKEGVEKEQAKEKEKERNEDKDSEEKEHSKDKEEKERSEDKEEKNKNDEVSLADCLDWGNENNSATISLEQQKEEWKEKKCENKFFLTLNSQIKKSFLLSSDESLPSSDESQPRTKKNPRQKQTTKGTKKKKKDDLSDFRIPRLSGESGECSHESWEPPKSKNSEGTSEEENSDVSIKCVRLVKNRKRERRKSETENHSSSEVEQVHVKTENSPTKGRKNIKKILKKENLQLETKQALKMETERKKRVSERQKLYEELFPDANNSSKLVLDFDPETKEELVVVDDNLAKQLKPHQKDGIRFMWNCCFESLKRLEEDSGSGCILAHCMGLGKSLQVITLVHTILTHNTGVQTVLIICPLNTVQNWLHEFNTWLANCEKKLKPVDIIPWKTKYGRMMAVKTWMQDGGVLLISYDMFRALNKKGLKDTFMKALLDPGPDLVVCDEGHLLKNKNTNLSKCISRIKTLRRIILTGTPLQNNLIEYYCMVQFVKPNILGTRKEFCNRFVHPINNGQFEDSTQSDVRLMKRRAHVLHTMLDGFIQRFGYYVLTSFLPEKQEYVISIALTEQQENTYRLFIEGFKHKRRELLKDYHLLQKVWTHPWVLMKHAVKEKVEGKSTHWMSIFKSEDFVSINSSGKLLLFFDIIRLCKEVGDKVVVFSQSLLTLNLIETFLHKANVEYEQGVRNNFADKWTKGLDYFRLDGSTASEIRDVFCQKFNNIENERCRLFLVSTKAGGLGISLVAANRVILFDASWNPTHDVQSIFRVYRFGQTKPCFIYRFLSYATMEEKIYRRQVTKLSLAHRILDEHQIERHYTMGNLQELYTYDPLPKTKWRVPKIPKDNIFVEILTASRDIIAGYHEHDSLLENKEEEELTEEERKAAWEDYEKEKLLPEQQFNGVNWAGETNNRENMIVPYRPGLGPYGNASAPQNEICRIVDVRTLHGMNSREDTGRLLEIGRSFGMKPFMDESLENYCRRIDETLRMIFPQGNPGEMGGGTFTSKVS